ncbi:MAG: D-Ala-D-Ala carboxypeptidase family metallohydrolase [Candidatus Margulisiibacteriota bacterium]
MGDISEHFSRKDFVCRCNNCKESFKISLTLIGVLEELRAHFRNRVNIVNGYRCPALNEEIGNIRKSYHVRGQAADIAISNVSLEQVFLFCETLPQVNGLGLYPLKNFVHIDVREADKAQTWVFINDYEEITDELREKYKLVPSQEQCEPEQNELI